MTFPSLLRPLGEVTCIFLLMSDFHTDTSAVREVVNSRELQRKAARHAHDVQFTVEEADFISSFYSQYPELFATGAGFRASTFEEWDTRTDTGLMFDINQGLRLVWEHLDGRIEMRLSGNHTFRRFAGVLRHHTETFWTRLKAFFDEHYHAFVRGTYGSESGLTLVQRKAGWAQVNNVLNNVCGTFMWLGLVRLWPTSWPSKVISRGWTPVMCLPC